MARPIEQFGCQTANSCDMAKQFQKDYESSGLEIFDIKAGELLQHCMLAQDRIKELAAFKGVHYEPFLERYVEPLGEVACPFYVLACEDRDFIPSLLDPRP